MRRNHGLNLDRETLSGSNDRAIGGASDSAAAVHFPIIQNLLDEGKVTDLIHAAEVLKRNLRTCMDWQVDFELSMQAETAVLGLAATITLMEDLEQIAAQIRDGRVAKRSKR